MGSAIKKVANVGTQIATGGTIGVGDHGIESGKLTNAARDLILGKKDPGTPDQTIDTNSAMGKAASDSALSGYNDLLGNIDQTAQTALNGQEDQARQNVVDQQMKAQDMVAQHGLGDSSIGINSILNQSKNLGDQVGGIRASGNLYKQSLLDNSAKGISALMGAQNSGVIFKQGQASKGRTGGLAPLIGAGIGGYMGGAQGAQMGMQLGNAATQAF